MLKRQMTCEYDELMVVAVDNPAGVDEVWVRVEEQRRPLADLIQDVVPATGAALSAGHGSLQDAL